MTMTFNDGGVPAKLRRTAAAVSGPQLTAVVRRGALTLQTAVQAGAPVDTGDYRRSINVRQTAAGDGVAFVVGTNKPQARRLEFGFSGADSLGRVYNNAPQPHFEPAIQRVGPQIVRDIEQLFGQGII